MSTDLIYFLKEFNILLKAQFGFRAKHSTTDALIQYFDHRYDTINNN